MKSILLTTVFLLGLIPVYGQVSEMTTKEAFFYMVRANKYTIGNYAVNGK